jgi:hypothetical protein
VRRLLSRNKSTYRAATTSPTPMPTPTYVHQPPLETQDIGEGEISSVADAVGGQSEPEDLQEGAYTEQAVSPESDTNLVPGSWRMV